MLSLLVVATLSTAGEPVEADQVILSPEAAAEEAHAELMGELAAMSEEVRTIDLELLKVAIEAEQARQAAIVALEPPTAEDSGPDLVAPVPVVGP